MTVGTLPPVLRSVVVGRPPEDAFRIFTERIGDWWPLGSHSVYEDESAGVALAPGPGGRIVERSRSGEECAWGEILLWEPPHRLAYTWHPGYEPGEPATEVELRFTAVAGGTRVELEHRGWEALGGRAVRTREDYAEGWPRVLDRYAAAAA